MLFYITRMHVHIVTAVAGSLILPTGLAAVLVLALTLRKRTRAAILRWGMVTAVVGALSIAAFQACAALVYLPPVWVSPHLHVVRGSGYSNSFPSHHALVAWLTAAAVFFASRRLAIPFVVSALITDVTLVLAKYHYSVDVITSTAIVAAATIAFSVGRRHFFPVDMRGTSRERDQYEAAGERPSAPLSRPSP